MKNLYNQDYYENGKEKGLSCYASYRWIPELTIPMCYDMISFLGIKETDTILDFGCAKGYTVKAMRLLHHEAYGIDISEYALNSCPEDVKNYLLPFSGSDIPLVDNNKYDWIIAKDVLEHVDYPELPTVVKNIRAACENLFVIVPLGDKGVYEIPEYELDVTHKIREPLEWWSGLFYNSGFLIKSATYKVKHIKENWASWEHGNGFFVLS